MSNNLSTTSQNAINSMVYFILNLSHLDNPLFNHKHAFGFPYEELIDFAYSLDNATDEEKEFIKSVIRLEFNEGLYLGENYSRTHAFIKSFIEFFDKTLDIDIKSFWFGKTVIDEIVAIVGEHIIEKYNELFFKLQDE